MNCSSAYGAPQLIHCVKCVKAIRPRRAAFVLAEFVIESDQRKGEGSLYIYLGAYAQSGEPGVRKYSFDPRTGSFTLAAEYDRLANPSWLLRHPRKPVLYAVEELSPEGRIVALSDDGTGFRQLCSLPSGGADPCHLSLSPDGRHLFAANYSSGSLAVFALDENGVPAEMSDFVQHRMDAPGVNPARQERAHVHFSLCDGAHVYVCDLGMDAVFVYGWDSVQGKLIDNGERIRLPGGSGPRHLAFSADGRYLYVLCELRAEIHVFSRDAGGVWRNMQAVPTVPEDFGGFAGCSYSVGAAVRIVDGETLCASNRGHDSLALFSIAADGKLYDRRILPSHGRTPRDVQAAGGCLIAANQDGGCLSVFSRDADTGEYMWTGSEDAAGRPSCVCVAPIG